MRIVRLTIALVGVFLAACQEDPAAPQAQLEEAVLRVDGAGAVLVEGLGAPQRLIEQSQGAVALFSPDRRFVAVAHSPLSNLSVCEVFEWQDGAVRYGESQNLSTVVWQQIADELAVPLEEIMTPRCMAVEWGGVDQLTLELTGRDPMGKRISRTVSTTIQ